MILSVQVIVMLVGVWTYKKISVMVDLAPKQTKRKRLLYEIWEGGVTVFSNPIMRVVVIQNVAMALFFMGAFMVSLPLVVREVFDGSSSDLAAVSGFNALGLVATLFILLRLGLLLPVTFVLCRNGHSCSFGTQSNFMPINIILVAIAG